MGEGYGITQELQETQVSYVVTRFPGNPVVGRGGDVAVIDIVFELAQVAYIVITAVILAKKKTVDQEEQLKQNKWP